MIPTSDQLKAYAYTQRAKPVMGRKKENVNPYTIEFYGDERAASWCVIFIWAMLRHFGVDAANLLGKIAWVPTLEQRNRMNGAVWHPVHYAKDAQLMDVMAMDFNHSGSPEHGEFFIARIDADHFWALGGNVGGDNVALNPRRYSDVYGFLRLNLAARNYDNYPGVLYSYNKSKPMQHDGYVGRIQQWLVAWGYLKKADVDDWYGVITSAAVKKFQTDHMAKGEDDSTVGPKTWAALRKTPTK